MKYKLTTYTYPANYFTSMAGRTVEAYDPQIPGLLIIARLRYPNELDIRKRCVVMHKATSYNCSNDFRSIKKAVEAARNLSKLMDFSKFKTVAGWKRMKKQKPKLFKQLKKAAGY